MKKLYKTSFIHFFIHHIFNLTINKHHHISILYISTVISMRWYANNDYKNAIFLRWKFKIYLINKNLIYIGFIKYMNFFQFIIINMFKTLNYSWYFVCTPLKIWHYSVFQFCFYECYLTNNKENLFRTNLNLIFKCLDIPFMILDKLLS